MPKTKPDIITKQNIPLNSLKLVRKQNGYITDNIMEWLQEIQCAYTRTRNKINITDIINQHELFYKLGKTSKKYKYLITYLA